MLMQAWVGHHCASHTFAGPALGPLVDALHACLIRRNTLLVLAPYVCSFLVSGWVHLIIGLRVPAHGQWKSRNDLHITFGTNVLIKYAQVQRTCMELRCRKREPTPISPRRVAGEVVGGALGVVQGVQPSERALLHRAQVLLAADLLLRPQALLAALHGKGVGVDLGGSLKGHSLDLFCSTGQLRHRPAWGRPESMLRACRHRLHASKYGMLRTCLPICSSCSL